jgi:hypothetical protein
VATGLGEVMAGAPFCGSGDGVCTQSARCSDCRWAISATMRHDAVTAALTGRERCCFSICGAVGDRAWTSTGVGDRHVGPTAGVPARYPSAPGWGGGVPGSDPGILRSMEDSVRAARERTGHPRSVP